MRIKFKKGVFAQRYTLGVALALMISVARPECVLAQVELVEVLPTEIRNQLEKFAIVFREVRLEYREKQEGSGVPDYYGGPAHYTAIFSTNRFYLRTEINYRGQSEPSVHEDGYDGDFLYYGDVIEPEKPSEPGGSVLKKYLPSDPTDPEAETPFYFGYPKPAGLAVPQSIASAADFQSVESEVLVLARESNLKEVETIEDKVRLTFQVLDPILERARQLNLKRARQELEQQTNTTDDQIQDYIKEQEDMKSLIPTRKVVLTLDPKFGYGIVEREEFTNDGQRISRTISADWKHYSNVDIWLPETCTQYFYTKRYELTAFSVQPQLEVTYDLLQVDFSPNTSFQFALEHLPHYKVFGTLLADRSTPAARSSPYHQVNYFVGVDEKMLLDAATLGVSDSDRIRGRVIAWTIFVVLLVPLIGIILRKHFQ